MRLSLLGMPLTAPTHIIEGEYGGSSFREKASQPGGEDTNDLTSDGIIYPTPLPWDNIPQFPTVHRVNFSMSLFDKAGRTVHVFTSMQNEVEAVSKKQTDMNDVWMKYPLLAVYHEQGQIYSPVVLFKAYLKISDDIPKSETLFAVELAVEFAESMDFDKWQSSTRVFQRDGDEIDVSKEASQPRPGDGSLEDLECLDMPQTTNQKVIIPFKSEWWSRTLADTVWKRHEAEESGDPEIINQEDERSRHYIEGVSIMQEIWATPRRIGALPRIVAIFLWDFKQTHGTKAGTTSWRRSSPSASQLNDQLLRSHLQDSTALDAAVHPSSMPISPTYFDPQASSFAVNTETSLSPTLKTSSDPATSEVDFSSCAFAPITIPISSQAYTSHPRQEPLSQNYSSEDLLSGSLESRQLTHKPGYAPRTSQGQDIFHPSEDTQWLVSNLNEENFLSTSLGPKQPARQFEYSQESSNPQDSFNPSEDIQWPVSNFDEGSLLPEFSGSWLPSREFEHS